MMTLSDWCRMADVTFTAPTDIGAVSLISDPARYPDMHAALYRLTDYHVVSTSDVSRHGTNVVWLMPVVK